MVIGGMTHASLHSRDFTLEITRRSHLYRVLMEEIGPTGTGGQSGRSWPGRICSNRLPPETPALVEQARRICLGGLAKERLVLQNAPFYDTKADFVTLRWGHKGEQVTCSSASD
jgi:hypothetical protein